MARTKGPLMSLDASGSVASTITYSKWKGRNYVRELVTPSNPRSGLQVGMRAMFKFVTQAFAGLSTLIKSRWQALADPDSITALDAMVRLNQQRARQGQGCKQDPTVAEGSAPAAPTGASATAAFKSLNLAWTSSATAGIWNDMVWMSITTGFTAGPDNLIAVIPATAGTGRTFIATRLTSGQTYRFRVASVEPGGKIGSLVAEFSGTPT